MKKGLYLTLITLAIYTLASCNKDKKVIPQEQNSPRSIGFQTSSAKKFLTIAQLDTAVLLGKPTDMLDMEVTLSAPLNIRSTVSATIVPDNTALNVFNANQLKNAFTAPQGWTGRTYIPYQQLPASDYTLQNGGKVTINPGQKSVTVRVSFAGDKIDFYNKNIFKDALSLKLTGVNGATLTDSLSEALIIIKPQSAYAGNYKATGTESFSTAGGNNFNTSENLTSVTPNTVLKQSFGSYSGFCYLTVNPDNSVSINFLKGVEGPFYVDGLDNNILFATADAESYSQFGVNKYDPVTKTFTLNYKYQYPSVTGSFSETLTLK